MEQKKWRKKEKSDWRKDKNGGTNQRKKHGKQRNEELKIKIK